MKFKRVLSLLALMSLLAGGVALAEEEMTPQQSCEQAAEEAGLSDPADVSAYVQTCLEDMGAQAEGGDGQSNSSGN
ncbi:MAG: hypothetical protein OEZ68_11810 [Gammaproteobacteria bacterium]|nr:hypothetical protein [Gammaproteobacteria bacterium]MDH5801480.1 hypothetical protein [Gammaproteobacteria bacterium]